MLTLDGLIRRTSTAAFASLTEVISRCGLAAMSFWGELSTTSMVGAVIAAVEVDCVWRGGQMRSVMPTVTRTNAGKQMAQV